MCTSDVSGACRGQRGHQIQIPWNWRCTKLWTILWSQSLVSPRDSCFCLPSTEITNVNHHAQLFLRSMGQTWIFRNIRQALYRMSHLPSQSFLDQDHPGAQHHLWTASSCWSPSRSGPYTELNWTGKMPSSFFWTNRTSVCWEVMAPANSHGDLFPLCLWFLL